MKPGLVIVGSGLGGSFLADSLAGEWDVTVVEQPANASDWLQGQVRDVGAPAVTHPHVGSGPGGTTAFWHNGLIEIDESVFRTHWPFAKAELDPYYDDVYPKLGGISRAAVNGVTAELRRRYETAGVPGACLGTQGLFYPQTRVNAWHSLKLGGRVRMLTGEVTDIVIGQGAGGDASVRHLVVRSGGVDTPLTADVYVLAAGGLGTPLLLQKLAAAHAATLPALASAGRYYEDHPTAAVGEVVLDEPLYRLWNFPVRGARGNLRLPMVVRQDGLQVSFQLRPAAQLRLVRPSRRVKNLLNDLRNEPFKLRSYLLLLTHWDDVLEILSFKLGLRLPTRRYSIVMVAEQPPAEQCAVWRTADGSAINRRWEFPAAYLQSLHGAVQQLVGLLGAKVRSATLFPDWPQELMSSSHHSGTARMCSPAGDGVCDADGRVLGLANLFVCDGALIPGSGFANTGLTIAALGARLGARLRRLRAALEVRQ